MKNLILSAILMAFVFASCESNSTKNSETTTTEATGEKAVSNDMEMYCCAMHPELTGKKGDKCSKCDMELTVPAVKENGTSDITQLYSCPMHPEVIGKRDEKCSKCGMALTVPVKK